MRRTNKKGFTIVELVIVIAVIAILAAVLIPTFASLVNKANRSADIQAVRQMNTALAANEVTEGKSISEVHKALSESGLTSKDYHPLASDTYFFWDQETNRVLYTDDTYTVIYPEERKGDKFDVTSTSAKSSNANWYTLSGEIKEDKVDNNQTTVTVSNAGQLYYLANNIGSVTEIKLDDNINLMGADIAFEVKGADKDDLKSLTIDGNGKTLTNLAQLRSFNTATDKDSAGKKYSSGLIPNIVYGNVTIKNITIKDSEIGSLETGGVGALIGTITADCKVTVEGCTIENTIVNGKNKVGGLIGSMGTANVTIKECKMDGVTVNCSEGQAAIVVGCAFNSPTITVTETFSSWVTNCETNLVTGAYTRNTLKNCTLDGETLSDITLVAELSDGKEEKDSSDRVKYRMYAENAYMTVQKVNTGNVPSVTIANAAQTLTKYGDVVKIGETEYYAPYLHIIK